MAFLILEATFEYLATFSVFSLSLNHYKKTIFVRKTHRTYLSIQLLYNRVSTKKNRFANKKYLEPYKQSLRYFSDCVPLNAKLKRIRT